MAVSSGCRDRNSAFNHQHKFRMLKYFQTYYYVQQFIQRFIFASKRASEGIFLHPHLLTHYKNSMPTRV